MAATLPRYSRGTYLSVPNISVSPPSSATRSNDIPQGWVRRVHPKGYVYFTNSKSGLVTNQDIVKHQDALYDRSSKVWIQFSEGYDSETGQECYVRSNGALLFINHRTRIATSELFVLTLGTDILALREDYYALRRDYWRFVLEHPSHRPLETEVEPEAHEALSWCYAEGIMRGSISDAPISKERAEEVAALLCSPLLANESCTKVALIAWVMFHVDDYRHRIHYGNRGKIEHDTRSPAPLPEHTNFIQRNFVRFSMVVPLLCAPFRYREEIFWLRDSHWSAWNNLETWNMFIVRMLKEWSNIATLSALVLIGNVGFITVFGIDAFSKTLLLISSLFCLGSVLSSLFLMWRNHSRLDHRREFVWYLANPSPGAVQVVSMILSIPLALLIWSILLLAISIVTFAFRGSTNNPAVSYVTLASSLCLIPLLLGSAYLFRRLWARRPPPHHAEYPLAHHLPPKIRAESTFCTKPSPYSTSKDMGFNLAKHVYGNVPPSNASETLLGHTPRAASPSGSWGASSETRASH